MKQKNIFDVVHSGLNDWINDANSDFEKKETKANSEVTHVPFGYKLQDGTLVQDEYQASILRFIGELYLNHDNWGRVNLKRIFKDLNIPLVGEGELSEDQKRLINDELIRCIDEEKEEECRK